MSASDGAARTHILSTAARPVSTRLVEELLHRHYGLAGKASALSGERDHNFRVRTARGAGYVVKIAHPAENPAAVELQSRALRHIAAVDPGLPVPAVILDACGASQVEVDVTGQPRMMRVLSYIGGTMLYRTRATPAQDSNLGAFLARLGLALQSLPLTNTGGAADETSSSRPADGAEGLLWDLQRMAESRMLTAHIAETDLRALIESAYDEFERHARDVLTSLPVQAIHNDMNPYNVVMKADDPARVAGIIDFGDMVRGPIAADVAVGAAYRWTPREHPLAGVSRFIQGYASKRAISEAELAILFDLVRARLALTINITHWQSGQLAGNRDYVLRLQSELIQALTRVSRVTRPEAQGFLRAALTAGRRP